MTMNWIYQTKFDVSYVGFVEKPINGIQPTSASLTRAKTEQKPSS